MERDVEMVMDLVDDYEEGKMTMRQFYRTLKEKSQGTLAKYILALCNRSNDSDKKNLRNIRVWERHASSSENTPCTQPFFEQQLEEDFVL